MTHRTFIAGLLLGVCLAVAAPTLKAADKETRQMMADIRMLQEQTQQLQNLISQLSKQMSDSLDTATKSVNSRVDGKLDEQNANTIRAFANQKVSLDAIGRDVNVLRERVDESNVRVGYLSQEVTALRQLVTTQINTTRSAGVDPSFGPADGAPAAAPVVATGVGASPGEAWNQAYNDYTSSAFELAIQGFQSYIKSFPGNDRTDDAQMFICNAYVQQGAYAKAIDACDVLIRTYPSSDKLAEAYYKKGLAYKSLGRTTDAKTAFDYVVKTFPDSAEATLAGQLANAVSAPAPPPRRP